MAKRLLLSLLLAVLMAAPAAAGEEAGAHRYKIGVVPWVGWSPAHVAEAKGFWKKRGLNVRVINFSSNQKTQNALKRGVADITFEMLGSAVELYMTGTPTVILCETDWSDGGDKIIVRRGTDLEKLKGDFIGVYLNQAPITYFLSRFLASKGLKISDFKVVEMEPGELTDLFIDRRFDIIISYDPLALKAEREGDGELAATSATFQGVIPEGMITTRANLKRIPAEDLVKIYEGWIEAVEWCKDPANWTEYAEILKRRTFKGENVSDADLKEMLAAVSIHDPAEQLERNRTGGGLYKFLDDLRSFLAAGGMLKKDFKPETIFDNRLIVKALREEFE